MADGISFNIDELVRNLDLTQTKMSRGVNKVLKESAEPLKDEIETNTNKSDGSSHRYGEGHAKDRVVITNVKGGMSDEKYVETGYDKSVSWRMYFVNFGTIYQKPQNIIQRSITVKKSEVFRLQQEGLKRALGT